jgi:vacuolar protein sorting-associated protein 13A/C
MAELLKRYKNNFTSQVYKIVGSLNIIGNPMGLLKNISTGIKDLRDKPAQGLVQGPA